MLIPSDKLREECGVVAIYGHPEASKLAYLSLYALQHRGQESAGIAASNGEQLQLHKAMGLVSTFSRRMYWPAFQARSPSVTRVTPLRVIPRCSMRSPSWWNATRERSRWRTTAI